MHSSYILPLEPSAPVVLGTTRVAIEGDRISTRGEGSATLRWFPQPRVELSVPSYTSIVRSEKTNVSVTSGTYRCSGEIIEDGGNGLVVLIDRRLETFALSEAAVVHFHLPNFPRTYRHHTAFEADGWTITLKERAEAYTPRLKATGGHVFTHEVRLARTDGAAFQPKLLENALSSLDVALSFAAGRWTGPTLIRAADGTGLHAWDYWRLPFVDPWRYSPSWLPERPDLPVLEGLIRGWLKASREPLMGRVLRSCVHWFVEANSGRGLEGGITMALIGLELLAWNALVNRGTMTARQFEKESAHLKVAEYLSSKNVGLDVAGLPELPHLMVANGMGNGVECLTQIRNRTVHPPKGKGFKDYPVDALEQAWRLSLSMLERAILAECGYEGPFMDRRTWKLRETFG